MEKSKIVTPTLLFLMVMLLLLAIFYNIAYKPLGTKIDEMSLENELLKGQRTEIEMAMQNPDNIKNNIEDIKNTLLNNQDIRLIDGMTLADDITTNAKKSGIKLDNITISEPKLAEESVKKGKKLVFIPATLSFYAAYENAEKFIGGFENSKVGAYKIISVDMNETELNLLKWDVSLNLYYYSDEEILTTSDKGASTDNNGGTN